MLPIPSVSVFLEKDTLEYFTDKKRHRDKKAKLYIAKFSDDNINATIFDKVVYQKLSSKPAKKLSYLER